MNSEKTYLYWLCNFHPIGAETIKKLYDEYGSFRDIYYIEGKELFEKKLLNAAASENFDEYKKKYESLTREYEMLYKQNIKFVTPLDTDYPKRLGEIHGYPMGLYVKGKLPTEDKPAAAIIGARNCSTYGKQIAEYMGSVLSREGIQIISGLALGIDGAGHKGAIRENMPTYGVLGCGINICYPKENYALYEEMCRTGGIITECRLSEPPAAKNFPMRNRIISGLSDVIIVVEAKDKSGSLITVGLALEQGKEIYVLPGRITDDASRGCNKLIKLGANVLTGPEDILDYFDIKVGKELKIHEKNISGLAKNEKMLYACLDLTPKFIEQIVYESQLPLSECMRILLELELGGYIIRTSGQYYSKKIQT